MTSRSFNNPMPLLDDRAIMVTGGTGSFGRAFVRYLLTQTNARRIIIFSRDEQKQDAIARDMNALDSQARLRFFIGDVRDESRLELAMRDVDVVVHAAALKIIPTAEYNPFECILTNVHGAENVVKASLRNGVKKVIALSTDKAANPINLYGASKLASDKIMVAANNLSGRNGAKFAVVRYGNVIGSRGSVVPLFEELVKRNVKALPITDPRMTRFWITLEQGVSFVLSSLELMNGGEIFVPKIPSMRITDLARTIAPNLPHDVVGIRPGEKLHEIMITEDDARLTLEIDDRYIICPPQLDWRRGHLEKVGAKPVPEGFHYSSDINTEWLDGPTLNGMIGKAA
ncbi:UDP-N-acetylglucosamine 4,6-dehydratase (inverting) [Rhodoplanes sp. Z2-YC6860]|uniref:UDP-N-acetylglucosamine 4,6-dehydratase (inverting) n=1 Tax=Rhodoplanes sp. Z2-YC6860 TaxID=674703 RepID=UPI00082CA264|nr:UDP-N-acetylglucosamine 4,6-dehydratase (inverting) [Rhodoplanes sp. Z2-YC6860]